jgi:hypothetical protein
MAKDLSSSFEKVSNSNEGRESSKSYWSNKKFLNISLWANRFSWIILSLYTINFLARAAFQLPEVFGEWSVGLSIAFLADLLAIPVVGIIYFLILQTISGGVLMLMDNNNLELIRALKFKGKNAILFIPPWANVFSWAILSLYTIYFFADVVLSFPLLLELFQKGSDYGSYINELGIWSQMFITFVIGIVYFLILQAISSSILIFQEKNA